MYWTWLLFSNFETLDDKNKRGKRLEREEKRLFDEENYLELERESQKVIKLDKCLVFQSVGGTQFMKGSFQQVSLSFHKKKKQKKCFKFSFCSTFKLECVFVF